jgi:hypothetical protein
MAGPSSPQKGDRPDLLTAALFIGLGGLGLVMSRGLDMGGLSQMGPGFLPRVVCWLLLAVGVAVGLPALRAKALPIESMRLRPVAVITIAIVGFAYAATHLGFVLASLWLIGSSAFAEPDTRWREIAPLALGLTLFGALVFVYALGVQVPLWPI